MFNYTQIAGIPAIAGKLAQTQRERHTHTHTNTHSHTHTQTHTQLGMVTMM